MSAIVRPRDDSGASGASASSGCDSASSRSSLQPTTHSTNADSTQEEPAQAPAPAQPDIPGGDAAATREPCAVPTPDAEVLCDSPKVERSAWGVLVSLITRLVPFTMVNELDVPVEYSIVHSVGADADDDYHVVGVLQPRQRLVRERKRGEDQALTVRARRKKPRRHSRHTHSHHSRHSRRRSRSRSGDADADANGNDDEYEQVFMLDSEPLVAGVVFRLTREQYAIAPTNTARERMEAPAPSPP